MIVADVPHQALIVEQIGLGAIHGGDVAEDRSRHGHPPRVGADVEHQPAQSHFTSLQDDAVWKILMTERAVHRGGVIGPQRRHPPRQ